MKIQSFFLIFFLICSCQSIKFNETKKHVIDIIIEDYYSKNKKDINKYNFFQIEKISIEEECLFLYRISPILNIYIPVGEVSDFQIYPTNYKYIYDNYFFWRNSKDETPMRTLKFSHQ